MVGERGCVSALRLLETSSPPGADATGLAIIESEFLMFQGRLEGIYIAERKTDDLQSVAEIEAVAGKGLRGDRYYQQQGTFTKPGSPDREVTLIEMEALEALARECEIALQPGQARRNLVTRGVPLNHLVGREFRVGEVLLRGIRLCEPCDHLQKLTAPGVKAGLCHRGGLRAAVVEGGVLRLNEVIQAD
jgi:MOSC domain-containing protein YiiM